MLTMAKELHVTSSHSLRKKGYQCMSEHICFSFEPTEITANKRSLSYAILLNRVMQTKDHQELPW